MQRVGFALVALAMFGLVACDDGDTTPTTPTTIDWPTATAAEKSQFMSEVVFPDMSAKFKAHDGTKFAQFTCNTCHSTSGFTMPNPDLPKLDPAAFPMPGDSDIVDFMYNEVTPAMVEHLSANPFDPATGEGFGCFGCHTSL